MIRQVVRTVLAGMMVLAGASVGAAEEAPAPAVTREWTATRQPKTTGRPLPSDGRGSDFSLMDQNRTPLLLGIVNPVQLPWGNEWDVCGLRMSLLYGRCTNLTGLDLGLANTVEEELCGLQIGLLNTTARTRGVQVGLINCTYYLKGVQVGLVNYAEGARGLQIGLVNVITNTNPGVMPLIYGSF